ncbi:carbohydrate kinase family protein [Singulisphaera sp. Ch08]|uniref:Carbohydrate kinase family protein n=1 Tax=Singulisphaera sp. Ch08 TaxID=3120278 RepID=A0AAU7CPL8_9BACT
MSTKSTSACPVVCAGVVVADHLCTPISHLPAAGELVAADDLILNIGGCASNAAIALAKLGVRAAVCGKVGDDAFGRFVAETLVANGVDVRALSIDPSRATSQTLIINVKGQDRRFVHSFGANKGLTAADLDPLLLDPTPRVLYVGGYLILPALHAAALAERFSRARKAGTVTVLDVATPGPGDYLRHLRAVLPETDVFLPNTDEAALILGETDPVRQALAFRDLGAGCVVITCGERGAVVVSDSLRVRLGTYPVAYLDGSGGGDAFDAGFIAGLIDGLSTLDCLKLASAVGASCVRAIGTTAGVFTRPEADAFIQQHELAIEPV